jgi:sodium-dependent dicarboxylate transporter 2/3/5
MDGVMIGASRSSFIVPAIMPKTRADDLDANPHEPESRRLAIPFDRIGLVLGPSLLVGWIVFVERGDLAPEAHRLAGVMLLTITWWLTEPMPISVTALLSVALCVILRAVPAESADRFEPARTVLAPLADPSVFFLLGGLFIGRAMMRHGLDRRIALSLLCTGWAGRSPATVLASVGLAVALVSMWISNTAATAMMFPVTLGIISVLSVEPGGAAPGLEENGVAAGRFARSRYASALLLITAYASSVGGIATPIGTATNVVAMGYFKQPDYFGRPVDFLRWSVVGVPMMLAVFAGMYGWLHFRAPPGGLDMATLRDYLRREHAGLGPWKRGEVNTLVVFLIVVTLWIAPGVLAGIASPEARQAFSARFPEEIVAVLAPVLLFLLPVDWSNRRFSLEVADFARVDWGTILLFGAGLSLGNLMFKTGLAAAVGENVFELIGSRDPWVITALAVAGGIVLSEFTSNAATASTLIPVVWSISNEASIDPIPPLMGVTFGASFGSALPVSTPPNAIVYGSGLIPVRRMIAAGIGVDLAAAAAIWLVLRGAYALGWTPIAR